MGFGLSGSDRVGSFGGSDSVNIDRIFNSAQENGMRDHNAVKIGEAGFGSVGCPPQIHYDDGAVAGVAAGNLNCNQSQGEKWAVIS